MKTTSLQQVAAGDRAAMQKCIESYGGLVWSLARRYCGNTADAEDAVQDIFIELWSCASRFDPSRASESTFIAMVARRRLIDRRRRRQTAPQLEPLVGDGATAAASSTCALELQEESAKAVKAMSQLREEERQALELSIYHGETHSEIAEKLSLPLGTVKTHIRRGLQRVRKFLRMPGDRSSQAEVAS